MKTGKEKQLTQLYQKMDKLLSTLYDPAPLTVKGRGDPHAPIMLIGEAPAKSAYIKGVPFDGAGLRAVNELLYLCRIPPEAVFTTHVCKLRPCRISTSGTISNRPPNKEEVQLFLPFLKEEITLLRPRLIITLGNTAYQALQASEQPLSAAHGTDTVLHGYDEPILFFPLFHPTAIQFNKNLSRTYREDLNTLKSLIQSNQDLFPQ